MVQSCINLVRHQLTVGLLLVYLAVAVINDYIVIGGINNYIHCLSSLIVCVSYRLNMKSQSVTNSVLQYTTHVSIN